MKFAAKAMALAVACLLVSVSTFAHARESRHANMTLADPVQIGNTQLKPGQYKLVWDGTGPDVNLRIMQGRTTVVTTSAKLVDHKKPASQDDVVLKPLNGQMQTIDEIDIHGRKQSLVLNSGK